MSKLNAFTLFALSTFLTLFVGYKWYIESKINNELIRVYQKQLTEKDSIIFLHQQIRITNDRYIEELKNLYEIADRISQQKDETISNLYDIIKAIDPLYYKKIEHIRKNTPK